MLKFLSISVFALSLLMLPCAASAQLKQGDKAFSLSGSGSSDKKFEGTTAAAEGRLDFMLTDSIDVNIAQTLAYTRADKSDSFTGSTAIGLDYALTLGKLQIFTGPFVGAEYGQTTSAFAGVEVRPTFWLTENMSVFVRGAYQFSSEDFGGLREHARDGEFVYGIGLEVKL